MRRFASLVLLACSTAPAAFAQAPAPAAEAPVTPSLEPVAVEPAAAPAVEPVAVAAAPAAPVATRRGPTGGPQLEGPRDGVPDCREGAAACIKNDLFALWPRLRLRAGYEFVQQDSQLLTVGSNDGFFLDQNRIGVDGAFKDDFRFRLIMDVITPSTTTSANDPVQSISAAVRDAWVAWMPSDWLFVSAGQQFMPSDLEGSTTIAALPFARRSVATSGMRAGHGFAQAGLSPSRQMGLVIGSTENARVGDIALQYMLGLGNGNGQNILGNDNKLPAVYARLGVGYVPASTGVEARLGLGGRYNPRTVGELPSLYTETDTAFFADATLKAAGFNVAGQVIYKQTTFDDVVPNFGTPETGLGATAWVYADEPLGISLGGVIPAYRFSYFDPSSSFADDAVIENTVGIRWNLPTDGLPLSLFVDGTLPTETGTGVRDLDNARFTALLQLEL